MDPPNTISFKNETQHSVVVHLDPEKPPCGVGKEGACNPADAHGKCDGPHYYFEEAWPGTQYDASNCGFHKDKTTGLYSWPGGGPLMSNTKFEKIKSDGSPDQNPLPLQPSHVLHKGESLRITPPTHPDTKKAAWCYKHVESGKMVCSGVGAWFTPLHDPNDNSLHNVNASQGVHRVEFNVNTYPDWHNWVLNQSAVDGINANIESELHVTGDTKLSFKCPTDLTECPMDLKGNGVVSMNGVSYKIPTCIAPKHMGDKDGYDNNADKQGEWAGAAGETGEEKLSYHKAWDYTSDDQQQQFWASTYRKFLRPEKVGSDKNCDTYIWAYDEQVCSPQPYTGDGNCCVNPAHELVPCDPEKKLDNPYAPLGFANVYDDDNKYLQPNITIHLKNIMSHARIE